MGTFGGVIGEGAFGIVQCLHLDGKEYAFKYLRSLSEDDEMCDRFLAEAEVLIRFDHRNIVKVYRAGKMEVRYNGSKICTPFYIMDRLHTNVDSVFHEKRKLSLDRVVRIIQQAGGALEYAYIRGIKAHDDLHPGNILLTDGLEVRLGDFGMMLGGPEKLIDEDALKTVDRSLERSRIFSRYVAPEIHRGGRGLANPLTDMYSLAKIASELMDCVDIPKDDAKYLRLIDVIVKASAIVPIRRYETIGDFISALVSASYEEKPQPKAIESPKKVSAIELVRESLDMAVVKDNYKILRKGEYKVPKDILIKKGAKLHLEAGVKLLFAEGCGIVVLGGLYAYGRTDDMIVFDALDKNKGWANIMAQGELYLYSCMIANGNGRSLSKNFMDKHRSEVPQGSTYGGGILVCGNKESLTLNDCDIMLCNAHYGGGVAILDKHHYTELKHVRIHDNGQKGYVRNGGGIYLQSSSSFMSFYAKIISNSALHGGGVSLHDASFHAQDMQVLNCDALNNGGGFFMENAGINLTRAKIMNNRAIECAGGGFYIRGLRHSDNRLDTCAISNNTAKSAGGGMFIGSDYTDNGKYKLALDLSTEVKSNNAAAGKQMYLEYDAIDGGRYEIQNDSEQDIAGPGAESFKKRR